MQERIYPAELTPRERNLRNVLANLELFYYPEIVLYQAIGAIFTSTIDKYNQLLREYIGLYQPEKLTQEQITELNHLTAVVVSTLNGTFGRSLDQNSMTDTQIQVSDMGHPAFGKIDIPNGREMLGNIILLKAGGMSQGFGEEILPDYIQKHNLKTYNSLISHNPEALEDAYFDRNIDGENHTYID